MLRSLSVVAVLAAAGAAQSVEWGDPGALAPYETMESRILKGAIMRKTPGVRDAASCAAICSRNSDCNSFTLTYENVCEEKAENAFDSRPFGGYISGVSRPVSIVKKGGAPAKRNKLAQPVRTSTKDMVCTTREVSVSDNFDRHFVGKLEALNTALFPGAIFYINDVISGSYTPVSNPMRVDYPIYVKFNDRPNPRATIDALLPSTVSPTAGSVSSATVAANALSVDQAIRSFVTSNPGLGNVSSSFETFDVTSNQQLNIAMKGAASYSGFDMKADLGFSSNENTSKQVAQLYQRYYAVSVDSTQIDPGVEGWIGEPEVAAMLSAAQRDRGPLVYVETVVYGRALYFTVEHTDSDVAIEAALEASYENASGRAEGSAETSFKKALSNTKMRYVAIGASVRDPIVDSFEEFKSLVREAPPEDGLGAPIAYVLRFVDDQELAAVNVNTTYPQRDCVRLNNKIRFNIPWITVDVADDEGSGAANAIEIQANASIMGVYDTYPNGADQPAVVQNTGYHDLTLGTAAEGGQIALGREGSVRIGRNVDLVIPDDPATTSVNEALTARIAVNWNYKESSYVYEVDSGRDHASNADDRMVGKNPQDDFRTISLDTFQRQRGEDAESYPSFSFVGGGNEIRIHYELVPVE